MTLVSLPYIMVRSLFITIIIEVLGSYLVKIRAKDLLIVLLAQIVTNPIVVSVSVLFNINFGLIGRNIALVFLELFAIIIEAIIYKFSIKEKSINPWTLSLILNVLSFIIGEGLNKIL